MLEEWPDQEAHTGERADVSRRAAGVARPDPATRDRSLAEGVDSWPDAQLLAAVRNEPPDAAALDALVRRYWPALHARCALLTLDREAARDLAQETWLRVLRTRRALQPGANFAGYLMTIATNLWRDRRRAARRAGPLAERRLASLDGETTVDGGTPVALVDALPDPRALSVADRTALAADLDRALARLSPRLRDVLLARHVDGETAAEIGRRYGRTEQSITSWLRQAIAEVRRELGSDYAARPVRAPGTAPTERREPTAGR